MSTNKMVMENPHEQVQVALLSRIINNMKTLNESVHDMNLCLNEINNKNKNIEVLSQMWTNYSQSIDYNLEATGQRREPL
ncbi:putative DASH complex subunit [Clavispora lusitaniae]|uniref:DASH complex subunit DAD4 n=1 Tax=Clavispora lusitaniae TaxID=36911 RepID=A0AA91Q0H2_CLALS|nr:putative DASH complex subunit [Clavispora lusitaniae]